MNNRASQGKRLLNALATQKQSKDNESEKPEQASHKRGQPAAASRQPPKASVRQPADRQPQIASAVKPAAAYRQPPAESAVKPAAATERQQEDVSDTISEFSPSESGILAPEFKEKLIRTKSWIDDHRNLTNAMASEFDFIDNLQALTPVLPFGTNQELTPTEIIDNITDFEGNDLIQLQPVTNTSVFMGNYLNEYTPVSDVAANILPSPNCKKRLFDCAESTDINLGTAPLETGTQSFAIPTSMLPLNAEVVPQANTLDKNENIIISSTEAPQQAEEVIAFNGGTSNGDEVDLEAESTVQDSGEQLGTSNNSVGKKRKRQAAPNVNSPTKKRQRNPSQAIAAKIKEAYNTGKPHITKRGKEREARSLKPGCTAKCRQECQARITREQRQRVFNSYYSSGNKPSQWLMISKMVRKKPVQRRTVVALSPHRKMSHLYCLPDEADNLIPVCQTMFLHTLDISVTVVQSAMNKNSPDKRGKHVLRRVRIAPALIQGVKDHIKSFPKTESHYCREGTKRQHLQENLSISKMYRMYVHNTKRSRYSTHCYPPPVSRHLHYLLQPWFLQTQERSMLSLCQMECPARRGKGE
ncbi:uncharacterized protein LOC113213616 [Frankliniella occidentalis]|uniref:Uncharacterized protein LOC113213616 n=1 Tax=Frankliniella occidentalis TaxID=133901 RepID=A0A6J1T4K0_FRAOC|nr:uncharacterized protein LOC113213616 [Frankliniella occidentalis]XP_052129897.1 uncharacterized protein LOC113213616 [Frankliniella occidentalis]